MNKKIKINRRRLLTIGAASLFIAAKPAILRAYPARIFLSAPLTLNVTPSGNDATADGSIANPFRNPGPAFDMLAEEYDLQGFGVNVLLQSAISPGNNLYGSVNISGRFVGQAAANPTAFTSPGLPPFKYGKQGGVVMLTASNPAYPLGAFLNPLPYGAGGALTLSEGAAIQAQGFALDTGVSCQDCVDVMDNSSFAFQNLTLCNAGNISTAPKCGHMSAGFQSSITVLGDYDIYGYAAFHMDIGAKAALYFNNNGDSSTFINVNMHDAYLDSQFYICDGSWIFAKYVNFNGTLAHAPTTSVQCLRGGYVATGGALNVPGGPAQFLEGGGAYT